MRLKGADGGEVPKRSGEMVKNGIGTRASKMLWEQHSASLIAERVQFGAQETWISLTFADGSLEPV